MEYDWNLAIAGGIHRARLKIDPFIDIQLMETSAEKLAQEVEKQELIIDRFLISVNLKKRLDEK